jgi:hypothetical protein
MGATWSVERTAKTATLMSTKAAKIIESRQSRILTPVRKDKSTDPAKTKKMKTNLNSPVTKTRPSRKMPKPEA